MTNPSIDIEVWNGPVRNRVFPQYTFSIEVPGAHIERIEEAAQWLTESYDRDEWRYWGGGEFLFRDHRVAVAFKLRYGCVE